MKINGIPMTMKCLFCRAPLQGDVKNGYASTEVIKCHRCGKANDYDSLINAAIDEGGGVIGQQIEAELEKELKKTFRNR